MAAATIQDVRLRQGGYIEICPQQALNRRCPLDLGDYAHRVSPQRTGQIEGRRLSLYALL